MPPLNLAFVTKVRVAFCPFFNVAACRYRRPSSPPPAPCARRGRVREKRLLGESTRKPGRKKLGGMADVRSRCRAMTLACGNLRQGVFAEARDEKGHGVQPQVRNRRRSSRLQAKQQQSVYCIAVCGPYVRACVHSPAGRAAIVCVAWLCFRVCSRRP